MLHNSLVSHTLLRPSLPNGEGAFFPPCEEGRNAPDTGTFPFASLDRFVPSQFCIRIATEAWEHAGCLALRRAVFCDEQKIFDRDDCDGIDDRAIILAAVSAVAVMLDSVVGTVRIHETQPGVWFGSRLAVDRDCRRVGRLGTELIRLAVSTAHARGATAFFAHVQRANVRLFESLHWRSIETVCLHGHPHDFMQADLDFYPPHVSGDISVLRALKAAA